MITVVIFISLLPVWYVEFIYHSFFPKSRFKTLNTKTFSKRLRLAKYRRLLECRPRVACVYYCSLFRLYDVIIHIRNVLA